MNPNQWERSVAHALELLMQKRHFGRTRHGFYRGAETVDYVEEILNRYRMYQRLIPLKEEADLPDTLQPGLPDLPGAGLPDSATAGEILAEPTPAR